MKGVIMRLVGAIAQLIRRFRAGEPASPYEQIAFGAFRSMLAVAFFPPGLQVVQDDARR
jgi:hypothetical protein